MNITKTQMKTRINSIIDTELMDRIRSIVGRNRQKAYDKKRPESKPYLCGAKQILDSKIYEGNIERFYGLAQIPVGLIGPLKVNGSASGGAYHVPLATTEGALVASYNRGAKVITHSGGANVLCISENMTRSPGFIFNNILEATRFVAWVSENFSSIKNVVRTTTCHGHLEDFDTIIDGNYVWLNLKYVTGDASGQNMVTIATDAVCKFIASFCPIEAKKWFVEANISGDKKATRFSNFTGRGKHMAADIVIPKSLVKRLLCTTPKAFVEYAEMAMNASLHTGSIGSNGHFANGLAAVFIACGQDAACVAESATGISQAKLTEHGDLYVSVSLPNLIVGTVGGGTHLPTQRESLEIMDCFGPGKAKKFAEICAATILAGEISIGAALTAGHFTAAHKKYGRKTKVENYESAQKNNSYQEL